jgi:hypothetical protein
MKLKAQTTASAIKPAQATMTWPEMNLPAPDTRFGSMNQDHITALQQWYASVQGALNARMGSMSAQIDSLTAAATKSTPPTPQPAPSK